MLSFRESLTNGKAFEKPSLQVALVSLLTDFVRPKLSAYKHAKLTAKGTQRIRPRQQDVTQDEIELPSEVTTVLEWVSGHIEVPPLSNFPLRG
jgi:hypothetical protein